MLGRLPRWTGLGRTILRKRQALAACQIPRLQSGRRRMPQHSNTACTFAYASLLHTGSTRCQASKMARQQERRALCFEQHWKDTRRDEQPGAFPRRSRKPVVRGEERIGATRFLSSGHCAGNGPASSRSAWTRRHIGRKRAPHPREEGPPASLTESSRSAERQESRLAPTWGEHRCVCVCV